MKKQTETILKWTCHPGPQTVFHLQTDRDVYECLFGGAKGPGKTDSVLREGIRQVHISTYRAIIFRRTYPQLGEIIDRSFKYFRGMGAKYSDKDIQLKIPAWSFPSGAKYAFGHCQHEHDKWNYQGKEFHYLGFDQVEQFTENQYLFLIAQNRTSDPRIKCYIRATGNPGGPGHGWVKRRFIDSLIPGKKKFFKRVDDEDIECSESDPAAISRSFIPSSVYDNPSIIQNDPNYVRRLEQLPETDKQALLYGNWEVFSGQFFKSWRKMYHVIEKPINQHFRKFLSMDYGYSAPSSVGWWQIDYDGNLHRYRELYKEGLNYEALAKKVMELTPNDEHLDYCSADPAIWGDRTHHKDTMEGESGAETIQKIWGNFCPLIKGDNDRLIGWGRLRILMEPKNGFSKITCAPCCKDSVRTIPALIHDTTRLEDVNCFIAGTMVETEVGEKAIESICVGEYVKTPIGDRRVIRAGISGYSRTCIVRFSNGTVLEGTPDHKIFIAGKGLVELQSLRYNSIPIGRINICRKLSGLMESDLPKEMGADIGNPMVRYYQRSIRTFTEKSGKAFTVKFQKAITFITWITIQITTPFKILNSSRPCLIAGHILKSDYYMETYGENLNFGENPNQENRLSSKTQKKCLPIRQKENLRARIVEELLKPNTLELRPVQANVKDKSRWSGIGRFAKFAGKNLGLKRMERELQKPVHIVAVGFSEEKKRVYNLTVEESHLYFANKFLVTNTDGEDHAGDDWRLAVMSRPYASEVSKEPPAPVLSAQSILDRIQLTKKQKQVHRYVKV